MHRLPFVTDDDDANSFNVHLFFVFYDFVTDAFSDHVSISERFTVCLYSETKIFPWFTSITLYDCCTILAELNDLNYEFSQRMMYYNIALYIYLESMVLKC